MAIVDKIQGTFDKLTNDDKRLNAAEITTIQQAYNAMQLGLVKTEFFLNQTKDKDVREMLTELRDDFLKPNLQKPRQILDKAGIPHFNMNAEQRLATIPKTQTNVFTDQEIILDTVLSMQATITGLQSGALVAVRGDVRDWFLNARDAAFEHWRKIGYTAYKNTPQLIPPTMSGVQG